MKYSRSSGDWNTHVAHNQKQIMKTLYVLLILFLAACQPIQQEYEPTTQEGDLALTATRYRTLTVDGVDIFFREAGDPRNPTIVLLHGFPSSSHQYRKLLNQLGGVYHLIAPDYPAFGESAFPDKENYDYTFDNIASTIDGLLEQLELETYVLMVQDYGAPIGFRIAERHPERVMGIINQNGNIYEVGLGEAWAGVKALWANRTEETEKALLGVFSLEGLKWQYTHGTRDPESINPDTWNLDFVRMSRPGAHEVNLDLFYDYQNNIKKYPEWQAYLRKHQPPMLIVWGKNDAFFPVEGAESFQKDVANLDFHILETGHFALEEEAPFIIEKIRAFMQSIN